MGVDTFYLIYAASLVFFMQSGFAMLCAGSVRMKNLQNTMLKNLLDACGASLGFYTVGYAFAWGGNGNHGDGKATFIGTQNFFLMDVDQKAFWLFQFAFAATSATIVAGTLAERCQMLAYLLYSTALTAFVYPVIVHAVWNEHGFLSPYGAEPVLGTGVVDFAGCLVVHTTGGLTALIAAYVLGPRKGRFYKDREGKRRANDFPGHSVALKVRFGPYSFVRMHYLCARGKCKLLDRGTGRAASLCQKARLYFSISFDTSISHASNIILIPLVHTSQNASPNHTMQVLGVFILWFGWYGFNTGSVFYITSTSKASLAQNAAVNTTLAAASGTISALLAKAWIVERETGEAIFSLGDALMGCLSGLVSITGGCAYVESWAAIVIGLVSGLLYLAGSRAMVRAGVDDAVDAVRVCVPFLRSYERISCISCILLLICKCAH